MNLLSSLLLLFSTLGNAGDAVQTKRLPHELKGVGIEDRLGSQVDLGLTFRNEEGEEVQLGSYFNKGKPVLLTLVYYECPMLCNLLFRGFVDGIKKLQWSVGKDYQIVTLSIDPREGSDLAQAKKENTLEGYGRQGSETGWAFLTGSEKQIKALASQVGFGYRYEKEQDEYAHGAAIFVLTPGGKLSRTLYGIQFSPQDLKLGLLEASEGKIGTILDQFVMMCFRYDPDSKGYSLYAFKLVQLGGAVTVVVLGLYLIVFWRRQRKGSVAS